MVCSGCSCSRLWAAVFLLSAVAVGLLVRLETAKPATHVYEYYSSGWMRECSKWDATHRRFIVSFFSGGMGVVPIPQNYYPKETRLEEIQVVKEADLAGNASLGFTIDVPRNRVIVAICDIMGNRYSALAAYDWISWKRLFLTQLSGPGTVTLNFPQIAFFVLLFFYSLLLLSLLLLLLRAILFIILNK